MTGTTQPGVDEKIAFERCVDEKSVASKVRAAVHSPALSTSSSGIAASAAPPLPTTTTRMTYWKASEMIAVAHVDVPFADLVREAHALGATAVVLRPEGPMTRRHRKHDHPLLVIQCEVSSRS
jgi:hypothetical protein